MSLSGLVLEPTFGFSRSRYIGIAYIVFGWVAMQVIDVIAGPFRLPDWTATLVLFLLMIGPPVALILSWAFELTPDGVKKTAEVEIGGSTVNDEFGASSH